METAGAFLRVDALDLEVVGEVKRDGEARFYRNYVLTGHSMRWGVRVSGAEQISLWLIKYTPGAGHWAIGKEEIIKVRNSSSLNLYLGTVRLTLVNNELEHLHLS